MKNKTILSSLALAALAMPASAATMITADIGVPGPGTGTNTFNSNNGTLTGDESTSLTQTYTLSNVDLTAEGGSANETIVFSVTFTGGGDNSTPNPQEPAYTAFGNVTVGNPANLNTTIDSGQDEFLTSTVSIVSTTFAGVTVDGFTAMNFGAYGVGETADVSHAGGTLNTTPTSGPYTFAPSSAFTITSTNGGMNLAGYSVQLTAVPEPSSTALLGLGGLALILRRRK